MLQQRPPRGHSCVRCKQRKIKCDGTQPCSACTRAGTTCATRPPATPRRRGKTEHNNPSTNNTRNQSDVDRPNEEFLIDDDEGNPRYVNHPLWEGLRQELPINIPTPSTTVDNSAVVTEATSLLWEPSGYKPLKEFHPNSIQTFQLWQVFLDNVHPLSKIIHAPSVQTQIIEAIAHVDQISRGLVALMFAVYLSAVNSLTDLKCKSILGQSKNTMHRLFVNATQQALTNAQCLRSCNLLVLQSLTLYLLSMRQYHDHQSSWLLTGLAVRSGKRIGLHKDGITKGITHFESEVRRRLWWQILMLDCRSAQLSGFALDDSRSNAQFSSRLPLNINESDLYLELTELPAEIKSHPTDMMFCSIIYECTCFIVQLPNLIQTNDYSSDNYDCRVHVVVEEFIEGLNQKFLRFCDDANPLHLLTSYLAKSLIAQVRIKGLQISEIKGRTASSLRVSDDDINRLLVWNTEVIEATNAVYSNQTLQPYIWFIHGLFPFESLVYSLMILQHPQVVYLESHDLAWAAIDKLYTIFMGTDWLPCTNPHDTMYVAISRLAIKAWRARDATGVCPGWVKVLLEKNNMHRQANPNPEGDIGAGLVVGEDEQSLDFTFEDEEFATCEINWDYWAEFMAPQ